jgi:hypothetical protein
MAETSNSRGKDPLPGRQDPSFSHSPDGDENTAPAMPAGPRQKTRHKKESWFQQNRVAAVGIVAGVALLVIVPLLCWMTGLFGSSDKPKPPAVASQSGVPETTPAPSPTAPGPSSPKPPQSPEVKKEEPKKEEPKKEEKPPLPEDVAKWKQQDYHRARQENDPKLLTAIARLGEKFPGNEKAARCLIDLLKPLPSEKPAEKTPPDKPPVSVPGQPVSSGGGQPSAVRPMQPSGVPGANPNVPPSRPSNPGDLTKLVETIVEALGCNGSETARGTFEQILAGTFATDDDKAAVEAALKALVAHSSNENDALLLRVLTAADKLRPAGRQGSWPAKDMKAKAFELVKTSASSGLRTQLAEAVLGEHAKIDPKEPIDEFLLAPTLLNCGAQLVIYQKAFPDKELKAVLEQQLLGYGSQVLSRCLDIPGEALPASAGMPAGPRTGFGPSPQPMPSGGHAPSDNAAKPADVDFASQFAGQLWSGAFRGLLESQLTNLRTLDKQPNLVLLAATIPQDSMRSILFKMLYSNSYKHWYEGPKALETAGLLDRVVTDPGLLVTIKTLPRKESANTPKASDAAKPGRGGPIVAGPRATGGPQKKLQAEQEWMDLSAKLVGAWCKRLDAAAAAKEKDAENSPATNKTPADESDLKLPGDITLPRGAEVVASHHIVLPDAAPAGFAQVRPDSLHVYYVRTKETNKLKKAINYYKGQVKPTSEARLIEGKKTWIDVVRVGSQKDRRRSIDVLITRPDSAGAANNDDEVELIVELLIIEIKDPKD